MDDRWLHHLIDAIRRMKKVRVGDFSQRTKEKLTDRFCAFTRQSGFWRAMSLAYLLSKFGKSGRRRKVGGAKITVFACLPRNKSKAMELFTCKIPKLGKKPVWRLFLYFPVF